LLEIFLERLLVSISGATDP